MQSPLGHYPSSRHSRANQPPSQDSYNRRSPTRDPSSRRSSSQDPQRRRHQSFPQIQPPPPPSLYDQTRVAAPIQYVSSIRLPLLRLGGPVLTAAPMMTQSRLQPPPVAVYPSGPIYVPTISRPPLPMLHLAPQLPPPVSLSPQATRADHQKLSYVQNMMHQYADQNRPRLQLLQLRQRPRTNTAPDLHIPMPTPNIVTTSSDTKVDAGIQAEVPRQDGFIIEPGLFQVSFIYF